MFIPKDAILSPGLASLHQNDQGWKHLHCALQKWKSVLKRSPKQSGTWLKWSCSKQGLTMGDTSSCRTITQLSPTGTTHVTERSLHFNLKAFSAKRKSFPQSKLHNCFVSQQKTPLKSSSPAWMCSLSGNFSRPCEAPSDWDWSRRAP